MSDEDKTIPETEPKARAANVGAGVARAASRKGEPVSAEAAPPEAPAEDGGRSKAGGGLAGRGAAASGAA